MFIDTWQLSSGDFHLSADFLGPFTRNMLRLFYSITSHFRTHRGNLKRLT